MKKVFFLFSLSFLLLSVRAELNVEWIDDNTIIVSGYGNGGGVTNENQLGSCTNCLAISPAEMHDIKESILSSIGYALEANTAIGVYASNIYQNVSSMLSDISTFRNFGGSSSTITGGYPVATDFTNYVYTVENRQTSLDRSVVPTRLTTAALGRWVSYNNGIYDYANSYVYPAFYDDQLQAERIIGANWSTGQQLRSIKSTVESITEESCQSFGTGGTNGISCSSCPCEEQWATLLDYIRHIDEDQHNRHVQLNQISNNVFNLDRQFDSYAKLVSGVLMNDATIVVDDGQNSWSNVYRRGYSDLYDYDKSNILQRIELLLFGVTYNTSTNWGDVASSLESDKADIESTFSDIQQSVEDGYDSLDSDVRDLRDSIRDFFDALNFFGSGHLGDFALTDPFTVFDVYTFEVDSDGNVEDLRQLQTISRTAFQIVYWTVGVIFMIVFWFRFIGFVSKVVLTVIKYLNNLLT